MDGCVGGSGTEGGGMFAEYVASVFCEQISQECATGPERVKPK